MADLSKIRALDMELSVRTSNLIRDKYGEDTTLADLAAVDRIHLPLRSWREIQEVIDYYRTLIVIEDDNPRQLHEISVKDCEFSTHTMTALQGWRFELTLADLDKMSDVDLLRISRFGRKALREVRETIADRRPREPHPAVKVLQSIADAKEWKAPMSAARMCWANDTKDRAREFLASISGDKK